MNHLPVGDLHESQAFLVLHFSANKKDLSAANNMFKKYLDFATLLEMFGILSDTVFIWLQN